MKAIYIEQTGGPEVLCFGERPMPQPGAGEVLVKLAFSGVNFTDLNARSGINKIPLPGCWAPREQARWSDWAMA